MPPYRKYVSDAQRRWAHTRTGRKALGDADVAGKDHASKGLDLPEHVSSSRKPPPRHPRHK